MTELNTALRAAYDKIVADMKSEGETALTGLFLYAQKSVDADGEVSWTAELRRDEDRNFELTRIKSDAVVDLEDTEEVINWRIVDWASTVDSCWDEEWTEREAA